MSKKKAGQLSVIDLFCGAGGFSEGFRQSGYSIVRGIDKWVSAVDTFNHNFNLDGDKQDMLDFKEIKSIDWLPDTDIIIGSPPCVSFSSSNKSGNADKTMGISLIEIFLKVVAVKKHQPNSVLKAWYMENVPNSAKSLKEHYSFADLGLRGWANKRGLNPNEIALNTSESNRQVLNAADFDVAQARKRLFVGEIVSTGKFPSLVRSQKKPPSLTNIFQGFPRPNQTHATVVDPNYAEIKLKSTELTDHFYDTGVYQVQWENSKTRKTNHPYMGIMSFPENRANPSRTITATRMSDSREALIYPSEIKRNGDGEYRTPTIREIGILMSFPITYQWLGSENTKWKLVGNAVCPLVSSAIAQATLAALNLKHPQMPMVEKAPELIDENNLNSYDKKSFTKPPVRKKGCRFRQHPFKIGNMTVALSNYCLQVNGVFDGKWRTTITYGTGKGFKLQEISDSDQPEIERVIYDKCSNGHKFISEIQNGFSEKIATSRELQDMHERRYSNGKLPPLDLIAETVKIVSRHARKGIIDTEELFTHKNMVYKKQLYALFAISTISQIANKSR